MSELPILSEKAVGWTATDLNGEEYEIVCGRHGLDPTTFILKDRNGEIHEYRANGEFFHPDEERVRIVRVSKNYKSEDSKSSFPDFPVDHENYALLTHESGDSYHMDHVRLSKNKKQVRYFYENSDVEKGDFYQIDEVNNGYEIYMKSPINKDCKRVFLDFHEMAVIVKLFEIMGNYESYKILKEMTK